MSQRFISGLIRGFRLFSCRLATPRKVSPLRPVAWTFLSKHSSSLGSRRYTGVAWTFLSKHRSSLGSRRYTGVAWTFLSKRRCDDIPVVVASVDGTPMLQAAWTFLSKRIS